MRIPRRLTARLDAPARQMLTFWGLLAVTVGGSAVATYFGFETLSAVRAYVGGEGLWSKAQKDATYHLVAGVAALLVAQVGHGKPGRIRSTIPTQRTTSVSPGRTHITGGGASTLHAR